MKVCVLRPPDFPADWHEAPVVVMEDTPQGSLRVIRETAHGVMLGQRLYAKGRWWEAWVAEAPAPEVVAEWAAHRERHEQEWMQRPSLFPRP